MNGPSRPHARLLSVAAVLACACVGGSGSPSPSPGPPPLDVIPDVANPQDATVSFDAERAVSASIPVEGGSLSVTATDGTVYTLTVSSESLVEGVAITMTPLTAVTGVDMTGTGWRGVKLEPEGLRFIHPVSLRISPPEGERVPALGFAAHGDGRDFHGHPLVVDPARLELLLYHFSDAGACILDCLGPIVAPQPHTPIEWWSRLENELGLLDAITRERLLRNEDPNAAEWARKSEDLLRTLWVKAVEPTLAGIATDCEDAEANTGLALWFVRLATLRGFEDTFRDEATQVKSTVVAALENCWSQTVVPCIDPANGAQVHRLVSIVRNLELLGADTSRMNLMDPHLRCGTRWTGTSEVRGYYGTEATHTKATANFSFSLVETEPGVMTRFQVESGTASWEFRSTDRDCVTTAGPLTFVLQPEHGELVFVTAGDQTFYSGTGHLGTQMASYSEVCPDRTTTWESYLVGSGIWLAIPPGTPGILSVPERTVTLEGTVNQPPVFSTWRMTR